MALDKQRILSELGSVVNQLQSADCGCMGKLFSNSNNNNNDTNMNFQPMGGQGYGQCHHHGHGHGGCCRNSSSGDTNHCMGHCNPPKLYHDTYNYLNKNLMQPVVDEVYNDLKSLNPSNAMSNSPLAAQMGLPSPQGNTFNQNNSQTPGAPMGQHNPMAAGNMNQMGAGNMNQMGAGNMNQMNAGNMNQMGAGNMNQSGAGNMNKMGGTNSYQMDPSSNMGAGMGPDIIKNMSMFNDKSQAKQNQMNAGNMNQVQGVNYQTQNNMPSAGGYGQSMDPMIIDAPQSPHGKVGVTPFSPYGNMSNNMNPNAASGAQQMTAQPMQNAQSNSPMPRGGAAMGHHPGHHHANAHGNRQAGMTKFSEMFPGVMQGDLGFDPMALAIQMNPDNQKKTAIDTMQNMMMGDKRRAMNAPQIQTPDQTQQNVNPNQQAGSPQTVPQPGTHQAYATNAHDPNIAQSNPMMQGQNAVQYQQQPHTGQVPLSGVAASQGQIPLRQQQVYTALSHPPSSHVVPAASMVAVDGQQNAAPTQQYATAPPVGSAQYTLAPQAGSPQYATSPATATQQYASAPPASAQQYANAPVTAQYASVPQGTPQYASALPPENGQNPSSPSVYPSNMVAAGVPGYGQNVVTQPPHRPMEASYPVDPRNLSMEYNTLGQPVEMVSAETYRLPYDNVPLTLSPQPMPMKSLQRRYSNVKNTVSKTSITGNVLGSKSLQHAYDVYKTQQSFAQPSFGSTAPHVVRSAAPMGAPIERYAGDVPMHGAPMPPMKSPAQQIMGRMGDAPMSSPVAEDPSKIPFTIAPKEVPKHMKGRNGIQDQTFTQYPMSTSWSFHGKPDINAKGQQRSKHTNLVPTANNWNCGDMNRGHHNAQVTSNYSNQAEMSEGMKQAANIPNLPQFRGMKGFSPMIPMASTLKQQLSNGIQDKVYPSFSVSPSWSLGQK